MSATKKTTTIKDLIGQEFSKANQGLYHSLPHRLIVAFRSQMHEQDVDPERERPFTSFYRWLVAMPPPGCGLCSYPDLDASDLISMLTKIRSKTPEDQCGTLDALITDLTAGHGASQGKGGRPKKEDGENCKSTLAVNNTGQSTIRRKCGAASLAARMAESADPKIKAAWTAYLEGKHRTVNAAAIACGLRKDVSKLARLKQNWRKASKAERVAFLAWLESDEGKTYPSL